MSFFTRMLTPSYPSNSHIAPHPRLVHLRTMKYFCAFMAVVSLIVTVSLPLISIGMTVIARGTLEETPFPWTLLIITLIFLCNIGFLWLREAWWRPLEERRLAAIQGDQRMLIDEQAQPNPDALEVPVKIAMHLSRKGLFVTGLILAIIWIVLWDIGVLLLDWLEHLMNSFTWQWTLVFSAFEGIVLVFVLVSLLRQRWMVEVRPVGIRSWTEGLGETEHGVPLLFWYEARFFACYREPGPWSNKSAVIYELSSASQVVLWTWVQKEEPLHIRIAPVIPFEEHQVQMRALRDLIAAKTGLPLHDLSKHLGEQHS